MRENYEFRVKSEFAHRLFGPGEGEELGSSGRAWIRKVTLAGEDPRLKQVGVLDQQIQKEHGTKFFYGWDIRRKYEPAELASAELFSVKLISAFEPAGEECGTIYDESTACPHCGAGRTLLSPLALDLRKIPKNKSIARTIADEIVLSERLVTQIQNQKIAGVDFQPVVHKSARYLGPVSLKATPAGRELIARAAESGILMGSTKFDMWISHAAQREMALKATREYGDLLEERASARGTPLPKWFQPVFTGAMVEVVPPTKVGIGPFDPDLAGKHRCPLGHVIGLNLISEVFLNRRSWDGSDILITRQQVGCRMGLLRPSPIVLISPRFYKILVREKIKGVRFEIAHLV